MSQLQASASRPARCSIHDSEGLRAARQLLVLLLAALVAADVVCSSGNMYTISPSGVTCGSPFNDDIC